MHKETLRCGFSSTAEGQFYRSNLSDDNLFRYTPQPLGNEATIFFRKNVIILLSKPLSEGPDTLIHKGIQVSGHYSHSMQSNAFSLILVSPVRSRDSDSTDYLYSPCSTASVYHFFISVIKRLFCCGLRGLFPRNHYISSECLSQSIWLVSHQTV